MVSKNWQFYWKILAIVFELPQSEHLPPHFVLNFVFWGNFASNRNADIADRINEITL
jgi:hypothetical protein